MPAVEPPDEVRDREPADEPRDEDAVVEAERLVGRDDDDRVHDRRGDEEGERLGHGEPAHHEAARERHVAALAHRHEHAEKGQRHAAGPGAPRHPPLDRARRHPHLYDDRQQHAEHDERHRLDEHADREGQAVLQPGRQRGPRRDEREGDEGRHDERARDDQQARSQPRIALQARGARRERLLSHASPGRPGRHRRSARPPARRKRSWMPRRSTPHTVRRCRRRARPA